MRRRSRAGGEPVKTRRHKTAARKRGNAPKAVRGRSSSSVSQETKVALLTRERDEALEQQKATAEILRVIRTSPADVQPVFETIVRNAVTLCGSLYAHVFRFDGELLHFVASHQSPAPGANVRRRKNLDYFKTKYPMRPDSSQASGRVLLTKSVVRLEDALTDPDYDRRPARAIGFRRLLGVPMLREGEPLGVIVAGWAEAGPVPKVQEELLKTFADQAVIAIENVRLFSELRESLDRQTATSEVLGVISSSAGELDPVFQAMLENAVRICDATFGNIYRWDGNALHLVAAHNTPPALTEARRRSPLTATEPVIARMLETKTTIHIDAATHQGYVDRSAPGAVTAVELGGVRTVLAVPMLKENELIGSFTVYRQEPAPLPKNRFRSSPTSPRRPSLPSRTRGCSMNCVNRCSNKPRPPTCSRSLVVRRSISNPCSRRSSNLPRSSAMPTQPRSHGRSTGCFTAQKLMASLANSWITLKICASRPTEARLWGESCSKAGWSISLT